MQIISLYKHNEGAATHLVIEEEVHKPWNALCELSELSYSLHRSALAAIKHMNSDLLGQGSTWK